MSGINKITAERNQRTLMELVMQPGNDVCADCKSRNPRWASHNLGIFICVHCASIHRKMGTHISKVKSLTMDSWTKEQVEVMKANGNVKSNAHYNSDETRNPPPTNMIDSERDSELEKYIRYKYEYKKFVSRSAQVAALLGPSKSASSRLASVAPTRSSTMPAINSTPAPLSSQLSAAPSLPTTSSSTPTASVGQSSFRSASQPVAPPAPTQPPAHMQHRPATQPLRQQPSNPLWNDLAQLQAPASDSSLPLQFAAPSTTQPMIIPTPPNNSGLMVSNQFTGLSVSPNNPFPSHLANQPTGMFPGGAQRSMSLNLPPTNMTGLSGLGASPTPSMLQPQPTMGGLSNSTHYLPTNTTPSPSPFGQQMLPPSNQGVHQQFAQSNFAQQMLPQGSPMISTQSQLQPQGSPMMTFQQHPQGSPMIPTQHLYMQQQPMYQQQQQQQQQQHAFGQPQQQMQMGNPFSGMQSQPQYQTGSFGGSPQPPFMGNPSFVQQQPQQQMYAQQSAFGGTGWQQPGYPSQQQQWGM